MKEIPSQKCSFGGSNEHFRSPHPSDLCVMLHRGQNLSISYFQSVFHDIFSYNSQTKHYFEKFYETKIEERLKTISAGRL